MADFTHKAGVRKTVDLITTDDAGTETPHPFEVLPLNHAQMDRLAAHAKTLMPLQERMQAAEGELVMPSDEDRHAMELALVAQCDMQLRSTNGGTTVSDLWSEGLLAAKDIRLLSEYLELEAGGRPPA